MLDYRMDTFLKLCELKHYRKTAEALGMTQPGVTQHIKFIEKEYDCKLFNFDGKKLHKTRNCELLEKQIRAQTYDQRALKQIMNKSQVITIMIGATKTIGDYVINKLVLELGKNKNYDINIIMDNTSNLLKLINENKLDFAFIEGDFDRTEFGHELFRCESFVGVVAKEHKFAGKAIELKDIFDETIILREKGSGTRAIFEEVIESQSKSVKDFKNKITLSSFKLIEECLINGLGISFAYESFAKNNSNMSPFTIKGMKIVREFNYVYLENTLARESVEVVKTLLKAL